MQEAEKEMDTTEFEQEVEELTKEQEMPIAELLAKYGIVKGEAADDDKEESSSSSKEDGYREDGEEGESGKSKSGQSVPRSEKAGLQFSSHKIQSLDTRYRQWRRGSGGIRSAAVKLQENQLDDALLLPRAGERPLQAVEQALLAGLDSDFEAQTNQEGVTLKPQAPNREGRRLQSRPHDRRPPDGVPARFKRGSKVDFIDSVSVVCVHETSTIASTRGLPCVFVCG
jgi:hypothetical protein